MKQILSLFILSIMLFSCGNSSQDKTVNDAKEVASGIKAMQPGGIPTTDGGWTMTATIDGKSWKASSIVSPDRAGVIVGDNGGESISLPYYDKRNFLANKVKKIGEGHELIEMRLNDDVALWTATKGQVEITKVDDQWAEGKFSFTAKGFETDKTKEVTDGFFRISIANPQK